MKKLASLEKARLALLAAKMSNTGMGKNAIPELEKRWRSWKLN